MRISGFTFVRNAVKYDYPVVESIRSVLPLVDEFIVSVGNSDDNTSQLIQNIQSPKVRIIHSVWDDSLRSGGRVLAVETDKAFAQLSSDSDWAFYIQADEVVHEKDYDNILKAAKKYREDKRVEGLLFRYLHFYGTYDYVGDSRRWYNREIRVIRNDRSIQSYRDAQGFRKEGRKLNVKPVDADIYHYGWVKHPSHQRNKRDNFGAFWGDAQKAASRKEEESLFDYVKDADSLQKFTASHPQVMDDRVRERNWEFDFDLSRKNMSLKDRFLYEIEKKTGKRLFDYRNYRII